MARINTINGHVIVTSVYLKRFCDNVQSALMWNILTSTPSDIKGLAGVAKCREKGGARTRKCLY